MTASPSTLSDADRIWICYFSYLLMISKWWIFFLLSFLTPYSFVTITTHLVWIATTNILFDQGPLFLIMNNNWWQDKNTHRYADLIIEKKNKRYRKKERKSYFDPICSLVIPLCTFSVSLHIHHVNIMEFCGFYFRLLKPGGPLFF